MRIYIAIIIMLIFLVFIFLIFNTNSTENFAVSTADYSSIEDLIDDNLLPNNPNKKIKLTEYDVIAIFRYILKRAPTANEMSKYAYYDNEELKEFIYNLPEYDKLIKIQDNNFNNEMESSIAKKNLLIRIMKIYKIIHNINPPDDIIEPLKDCFIHLQLNDYLFISMLENINYMNFETEILSTYVLSKQILLKLFNKHFNIVELKMIAQGKINNINNIENNTAKDLESVKDDIVKVRSILDNNIDINEFIKNTFPNVYKVLLKSAISDSDNLDNKDKIKYYLDIIENYSDVEIKEKLEINDKTKEKISNLPNDTEIYYRIYDPINYKSSNTKDINNRPPICTSLGQPQLTQPIFTESKLLFQGTDFNKAFEETQVGSIMPKFIYKEYQDVRIN